VSERRYHHVLITGGAGGIGEALAHRFLRENYRVTLVDQRAADLARIRQAHPMVRAVALDVTDVHALVELGAELGSDPQGPDVVINSAGVHQSTPLCAPGYQVADQLRDIEREVRTNVIALAQNCAIWIPYLRNRAGGGAIVNMASALALVPKYSSAVYCASKAAVHQFSRILAMQLEGSPVRIVTVYPPMVATAMTAGRHGPRTMTPDRFAQLFYDAFARGEPAIWIGGARWLYWLHRVSPRLAASRVEP
jgi:short-subunit dehydrogenase involved in D-alanine esterification of teichoic acids